MENDRVRIKGITGLAMFFAFLHGFFDRILKRDPEHYQKTKIHIYQSLVYKTYQELEKDTAVLHTDSDTAILTF